MSISGIAFSSDQPAQPGGAAFPRAVLVERIEAGVGARLQDRARDGGAARHVHVIDDRDVSLDHRPAADGAVRADARAAGDAGAAGDRGMRADAAVVADLDLVVEL